MPISRTFVAACLTGGALASAPALADDGKRPDKVSFYFAAHEDDWQLLMILRFSGRDYWRSQDRVRASDRRRRGPRHRPGRPQTSLLFGARKRRGSCDPIYGHADAVPGERIAAAMSFNGHMIYPVN